MKIHKSIKLLLSVFGLVFASTGIASAAPVTFQVNMENQTLALSFNPLSDIVEVRGSFNAWAGGFVLTPSATNPSIYEGVWEATEAPGSQLEYKFVIVPAGGAVVWEGDVGDGTSNRTLILEAAGQTVPVVYFNNQEVPPGAGPAIIFRVNVGIQIALGNFDPDVDFMEVRGGFNGWGPGATMTPSGEDPNVHTYVYYASEPAGSQLQYKFVINDVNEDGTSNLGWEGNVGDGMQNRAYVFEGTEQELPVVFYNNLAVDPGAGVPVTFSVNMSVQAALGNFVPGTDIVEVRGQFNNWGGGAELSPSPADADVYAGTIYDKADSPGSTVPYKFVIVRTDGGETWEGDPNRTFVLEDGEQSIDVDFFDREVGPSNQPVTFQVNMAAQIESGEFDPASQTQFIQVLGTWDAWAAGVGLEATTENPNIYTGTLLFDPNPAGTEVQYQFGIFDTTNFQVTLETIDPRTYSTSSSEQTLPIVSYNDVLPPEPQEIGPLAISLGNDEITISWPGQTGVHLQSTSDVSSGQWQDVPNTDGQSEVTLPIGEGNLFFRGSGS